MEDAENGPPKPILPPVRFRTRAPRAPLQEPQDDPKSETEPEEIGIGQEARSDADDDAVLASLVMDLADISARLTRWAGTRTR